MQNDLMNAVKNCLSNNDHLDQRLFSDTENIHSEIADKLMNVAGFLEGRIKEILPSIETIDILLQGSSVCYTYNQNSDIDLQIDCKFDNLSEVELNTIFKYILRGLQMVGFNFKISNRTVDFCYNAGTHYIGRTSSGVYSLKNMCWLSKPIRGEYSFSHNDAYNAAFKLSEDTENFINSLPRVNGIIDINGCNKIYEYINNLSINAKKKAYEGQKEYELDYNVFRILRKSGEYRNMQKYLVNAYNTALSG